MVFVRKLKFNKKTNISKYKINNNLNLLFDHFNFLQKDSSKTKKITFINKIKLINIITLIQLMIRFYH